MTPAEAIEQLLQGTALRREQARDVMDQVMAGEVTTGQLAGVLIGCVEHGASVSFMHWLPCDIAVAFGLFVLKAMGKSAALFLPTAAVPGPSTSSTMPGPKGTPPHSPISWAMGRWTL